MAGPEPLRRRDMAADPLEQFAAWFDAARTAGQPEPEAMALATADSEGRPSVRYVLLKGVGPSGFTFYTNTASRKAAEIGQGGRAALAFRWEVADRQVRVVGTSGPVPAAESDAYFATRPRGSQLAAWASDQSRPLGGRAELEERLREAEARFAGRAVNRPPWWGGYRVEPDEIEFWQQGPHRLHDRFRYERDASRGWRCQRLYP